MNAWTVISNKLNDLKSNFQLVAKRIIKSETIKNSSTLHNNLNELIKIYNSFLIYISKIWNCLSEEQIIYITDIRIYFRDRLLQAIAISGADIEIPIKGFKLVDFSNINRNINDLKMSEDNINFIKLASSIVSHFNGENDKLQTFINSVELLQKIVTGIDTNIIIQFNKTRLGVVLTNLNIQQ